MLDVDSTSHPHPHPTQYMYTPVISKLLYFRTTLPTDNPSSSQPGRPHNKLGLLLTPTLRSGQTKHSSSSSSSAHCPGSRTAYQGAQRGGARAACSARRRRPPPPTTMWRVQLVVRLLQTLFGLWRPGRCFRRCHGRRVLVSVQGVCEVCARVQRGGRVQRADERE